MGNLINDRLTKPAPKNRVSVLFVLSLGVILAIIGVSSWSYFGKQAHRPPAQVTASTEISAPVETALASTGGETAADDAAPRPGAPQETLTAQDAASLAPQSVPSSVESLRPTVSDAIDMTKPVSEMDSQAPEAEATASETTLSPAPDPVAQEDSAAAERESEGTVSVHKEAEAVSNEPTSPFGLEPEISEMPEDAPVEPSAEISPVADDVQEEATHLVTPSSDDVTAAATVTGETASPEPVESASASAVVETADEKTAKPAEEETLQTEAESGQSAAVADMTPQIIQEPPADTKPQAEDVVVFELQPKWKKFAAAFTAPESLPRIAIVISEAGISSAKTREAIEKLPAAVTLGFNPYGQNLQILVDEARAAGHEVLLQLPMEPVGYPNIDPGPQALRTDLRETENLARLDWVLNRITGYAGLTNQMGSKFTATADAIRPVLAVVREKGLLFLDSRTASDSVAAAIAAELEIPVAINNRFLDHRADGDVIAARLQELEAIARKTGTAVGVAYPHEETYRRLVEWTNSLQDKGLALAPVSALVNRQDIR